MIKISAVNLKFEELTTLFFFQHVSTGAFQYFFFIIRLEITETLYCVDSGQILKQEILKS